MRPHLALRDFSYIVVLIQRKTHFKLFTAFPVEREARRLKYRKEYEASEGPEKHDAASKDGM